MPEADTFCYKDDTTCQELVISMFDEGRICFVLSFRLADEKPQAVYEGYASVLKTACLAPETDFAEDGSLYPVIEYWYEDRDIPLSIRINDDIGLATISFTGNPLPYLHKRKEKEQACRQASEVLRAGATELQSREASRKASKKQSPSE